jgi:hypothetical protein
MMLQRLPIVVLGNSDAHPGASPDGVPREQLLSGPKGMILLRSGRCLAAELVERIRTSQRFEEPLLLGPRDWYTGKVDCEIQHVEGSLIHTLRQLTCTVQQRWAADQPFAVTSCDILPTPHDLQGLVDIDYAPHADAIFWWQMIHAQPDQMGAGAWKPGYLLPSQVGGAPQRLYPGHVVIAREGGLRSDLLNRLLELAYHYRNRRLEDRCPGIICGALMTLLRHDLRGLGRCHFPSLTLSIPYYGLRGYYRYRHGRATLADVEQFLTKAFVHRRWQGRAHGRPVVIAVSQRLAFAKDIDTLAELVELQTGDSM